MKKILVLAVALSGMASVAMAQEPVKLTEAQMDEIAGGAATNIEVVSIDQNTVNVAVPVNAGVAAAVAALGAVAGVDQDSTQRGRIDQRR
jgi:hypothetical protein